MAHEDDVLRLKDAYRSARLQAFLNSDSADAEQEARRTAAELTQFYLAGGQDMAELTAFFSDCDQGLVNYLAG